MAGLFNTVVAKVPRRNPFSRSYENHLTVDFGKIVPLLCEEVYPGDLFKIQTEVIIKLAALIAPAMSRIDAFIHYFFVPNRLLYEDWEKFITGGLDGTFRNGTSLVPVAPAFDFNTLVSQNWLKEGKLLDYFNMPSIASSAGTFEDIPPISALPPAAYQKIYSDWYRDELLSTVPEWEPLQGGVQTILAPIVNIRYRCWKKDYFTSARPDTQLGPQQSIPISGDIVPDGNMKFSFGSAMSGSRTLTPGSESSWETDTQGNKIATMQASTQSGSTGYFATYDSGLSLDDAGILINDLRRSLRAQEWLEKNSRGGNRYIENIFHHFGVRSSDARLQRSQYLGGRKIPVVIGEINQTTDTEGDSQYTAGKRYLGSRGGIGNASGVSQTIRYRSEEHGFILGLLSIMPHASYMQGIPRMFGDRWDRFSYMWPEFGNLGEQEVYNWELFVEPGTGKNNGGVFGYQSRYADLKTNFGQIHGEFRTNLRYWHNARIFTTRPNLNESFVTFPDDDTAGDQNRIFAVKNNSSASHFQCHFYNHVKCMRMLPKFGIPSI